MENKIQSIDQFIEAFENADKADKMKILGRIDIPASVFDQYATWKAGGYTRNCIARNQDVEYILICWDSGAKTPIHGHADQDCWVYQIAGNIHENIYDEVSKCKFQKTKEGTFEAGQFTYMHDRMGFHTLENATDNRAMTLHIYASPIDRCQVFNYENDCFDEVEMVYDKKW